MTEKLLCSRTDLREWISGKAKVFVFLRFPDSHYNEFWAYNEKPWFYQRNLFRYFLSRSFILLSGCLFYEAPIRIRIKYIIRNTKCMGINLFKCEAFSFLAKRSSYKQFWAEQMNMVFKEKFYMPFLTGV